MNSEDEASEESVIEPFQSSGEAKLESEPGDILRIEQSVNVHWSGVRKCCERGRPQQEVTNRFDLWVGEKIRANRPHVYFQSGHGGGTARCRGHSGGGGAASCGGDALIKMWIEFITQ